MPKFNVQRLKSTFRASSIGRSNGDIEAEQFLAALGLLPLPPKTKAEETAFLLALVNLVGQCEHVFRLRHFGTGDVALLGATLPALAFGERQKEPVFAGGRGLGARNAFISCMCEIAERLSTRLWQPRDYGGEVEKISDTFPVWSSELGLNSQGAVKQIAGHSTEGHIVAFPWVGRNGIFGSSSGCAVGQSFEDAVQRASLEAIERHAVASWWFGGTAPAPAAPPCMAQIETVFGSDKSRRRWMLDLTPNASPKVFVSLSSDATGRGLIVGASAAKEASSAALSSALELCQMEAAAALALERSVALGSDRIAPAENLWLRRLNMTPPPHAFPDHAGPDRCDVSMDILSSARPIFVFDLRTPDLNLPVARVIAPKLRTMRDAYVSEIPKQNIEEANRRQAMSHLPPPI